MRGETQATVALSTARQQGWLGFGRRSPPLPRSDSPQLRDADKRSEGNNCGPGAARARLCVCVCGVELPPAPWSIRPQGPAHAQLRRTHTRHIVSEPERARGSASAGSPSQDPSKQLPDTTHRNQTPRPGSAPPWPSGSLPPAGPVVGKAWLLVGRHRSGHAFAAAGLIPGAHSTPPNEGCVTYIILGFPRHQAECQAPIALSHLCLLGA